MKATLGAVLRRNFNASRLTYEIPEEYHNSFYLANASLLQIVNYFVHSSFKIVFPELVESVRTRLNCSQEEAATKIRNCITHLDQCEALVDLHIPMRRYHGGASIIRANRAYHGLAIYDKCLGGFRFNDELSKHNSQGFAAQQTYRNALFGLEMGGAAGGIRYCPFSLDACEISDVLRNYMARTPRFDSLVDLVEPDLGASAIEMDVLHAHRALAPHVRILGKTEAQGGVRDHAKASGRCVVQCVQRFLEHPAVGSSVELTGDMRGKTYILQGLGKVGKEIALLMHRVGAQCVGVCEHDAVLFDPAGIHVKALFKHIAKFGTMRAFSPKCREHDMHTIFLHPCDVLILAALERTITCSIADKVQAKVLVEAANLPISPTAYRILTHKKKLIIPGILAGAGPSLMSYYEHRIGSEDEKIDPKHVPSLFNAMLQTTIDDVIDTEGKLMLKFNFLEAAYVRAIRNLFKRLVAHQLMQETASQKMISMQ